MGSHKKKGCSSPEPVPAPTPDLNCTGTLSPDSTCNYFSVGTYGGGLYFKRSPAGWFIWWYAALTSWIISQTLGSLEGPYWRREGIQPFGYYNPLNGASGIAFVSAGGH